MKDDARKMWEKNKFKRDEKMAHKASEKERGKYWIMAEFGKASIRVHVVSSATDSVFWEACEEVNILFRWRARRRCSGIYSIWRVLVAFNEIFFGSEK